MRKQLFIRICYAIIFYISSVITVNAQTVAILDQGYNSTLSHRGSSKFTTQHCISYQDRFVEQPGPPPPGFSAIIDPFNASLCNNGLPQQFFNGTAAAHPRTFFVPPTGDTFTTSNKLDHARDMSNAIWDFNRSVFHQHFQVFGMAGNHASFTRTLAVIVADNSPQTSSYKTNSGVNIAQALNFLSFNSTSDLGAVAISTVVGNRVNTPNICTTNTIGQAAVDRLRDKGIAVIAGLANNDIPSSTKTWPNCLRGVINVGRTDGFGSGANGIGIGSNGIDFYAKSAVVNGSITSTGNSFAGPKVAAAFALLHKAHPTSTVVQKYQALQEASSSAFTYKSVKRRRIKNSQVNDAITRLGAIVTEDNNNNSNPNDNIHSDPTNYGIAFGGTSTDKVKFDLDFSNSIVSRTATIANQAIISDDNINSAAVNTSVDGRKDVILNFTSLFDESQTGDRRFRFIVNNFQHEILDGFPNNQASTRKLIINRNFFQPSQFSNIVELRPINANSIWGIRGVSINLLPTIPLQVGVIDTQQYGYLETPTRYTGARFKFDLSNGDLDYKLTLTGWDIDRANESQVFLNGTSIGFLSTGSNNSYSTPKTFLLPRSLLSIGANIIELEQRLPDASWSGFEDEKWAVRNILVEPSRPDLAVTLLSTSPKIVDLNKTFTAIARIENQGDAVSSIVEVKFYVSSDNTINASDTIIGTTALTPINPNQIVDLSRTELDTQIANRDYFLFACADTSSGEINLVNNCSDGLSLNNIAGIIPVMILLIDD